MLFRFIFYSNIIKDYFENLENRIINYLLINNNYVVLLHQLYIIEKKELLKQIDLEIQKLDSLQKVEYFIEKNKPFYLGGTNMAIFSQQPTQLYYKDILNLTSQKNEIQKTLAISKEPITVVQKLTYPIKIKKNISHYLIISFLSFFVIFYITKGIILENQKTSF